MDPLTWVALAVVAASTIVLAGVVLVVRKLQEIYAYRRREHVLRLFGEWRQVLDQDRLMRHDMFRFLEMNDGDINALVRGCAGDPQYEETRLFHSIIGIMNLFQQIAVSWAYEVGDREMIATEMAPTICRMWPQLKVFDEAVRNNYGRQMWPVVNAVVAKWDSEK